MFAFLDIETTGLDPNKDKILEVAVLQVSGAFEVLSAYQGVIKPDGAWKHLMDDYVVNMHTTNGLIEEVDNRGQGLKEIEVRICKYLKETHKEKKITIAGNSIQFDRSFIKAQMPDLESMLHHRMLDVSSIKMMVEQNWPSLVQVRHADPKHRAFEDAAESLASYRHYITQLNPRKRKPWC